MSADRKLEASPKIVDTLSKILTQAERAEPGTPEHELFMERAMRMSQVYSIDLAVARAHQAKKERIEEPERRTFKVGVYGKPGKNAHFVDLLIAIFNSNDIECTISQSRVNVFGTGMPSDLDVAERLFAILSVQMVNEAEAGIRAGANTEVKQLPKTRREEIPEEERAWGQHDGSDSYGASCYYDDMDEHLREVNGQMMRNRYSDTWGGYDWVKSYPPPRFRNVPIRDEAGEIVYEDKRVSTSDARVWRVNFYSGFVSRVSFKLQEARRQALREAGVDFRDDTNDKAIALRDKTKEVREAFEENEKFVLSHGGTYGGAEVNHHSYSGARAGAEAGDRARLGNEKDLPS